MLRPYEKTMTFGKGHTIIKREHLMMFNKLGRRKNPHPSPPPQAMEGIIREGGTCSAPTEYSVLKS